MNPDQIRSYVEAAFRAHEHKLRAYIGRQLNALELQTDDVLSVTFERLIKALERAVAQNKYDNYFLITAQRERPESAQALSALRSAAKYVIKDVFRNGAREPRLPDPVRDPEGGEDLSLPGDGLEEGWLKFIKGLSDAEASETYRRILEEIFRQTTRAFEKAVLIGMAYGIDDDEIAARFGRQRIHVQRARHLLRKRAKEIASRMLED